MSVKRDTWDQQVLTPRETKTMRRLIKKIQAAADLADSRGGNCPFAKDRVCMIHIWHEDGIAHHYPNGKYIE